MNPTEAAMELEERTRPHRQALWGVLLMTIGGAFLLDRLGVVDIPSLSKLWPAVLLILGASKLFEGRPGSGVTLALMGLAFFAAEFHWMGLTWSTFWPLLLLAVGVGIVIRAFSREDERCCEQEPSRD
jgi:hypothetical protein